MGVWNGKSMAAGPCRPWIVLLITIFLLAQVDRLIPFLGWIYKKNRIYLHAASSERSSYAKGQLGGLAGTTYLPAFLYGGKSQKIIYASYPRTVQKVSLGGFHVG